jgi:hypothetical protein
MRKAGLTNAQILTCSTINPAIGFGIADKTGSIDAGKTADLLLLSRNPLENIDNLNSIEAIFKDGEMISPEGIIQESPEAIVQRQLNAYNGRNLDLFLASYSPDVEIYEKGKLTMKGQERMRAEYEPLFKDATNLYCHIDQRIVIKNKVIDKETVRAGERTLHAVAIYEVENGKIKKVTFLE